MWRQDKTASKTSWQLVQSCGAPEVWEQAGRNDQEFHKTPFTKHKGRGIEQDVLSYGRNSPEV